MLQYLKSILDLEARMESLESLRVDLPVEVLRPRRTRSRRPESRTGAKADALERDLLAVRAHVEAQVDARAP